MNNCPVCGAPNRACAGHASFDPAKVFDMSPAKPTITGGVIMGSKGVEGGKERYPQQHVRAGRGTPGYTGDVEVYATPIPASFQEDGGVSTLVSKEKEESKGYGSMKNDDLRAALEAKGLPTSGNHGDLVARLEDADKA